MSESGVEDLRCPFCAEPIKPAAVKCGACRADLPPRQSASAAEGIRSAPDQESDDAPRDSTTTMARAASLLQGSCPPVPAEDGSRSADEAGRLVPALLALLCVGLAAGIAWLIIRDDQVSAQVNGASQAQVAGPVGLAVTPGSDLRGTVGAKQAMRAAAENAVALLSYHHSTLPQDRARAHAVMTQDFIAEYDAVMKRTAAKVVRDKLSLEATVVGTSLVSFENGRAVALLFVNARTTSKDSPETQLNQNRVLMTMTRKDGDWIVSQIDAF